MGISFKYQLVFTARPEFDRICLKYPQKSKPPCGSPQGGLVFSFLDQKPRRSVKDLRLFE